jgi:hypothetical protein
MTTWQDSGKHVLVVLHGIWKWKNLIYDSMKKKIIKNSIQKEDM